MAIGRTSKTDEESLSIGVFHKLPVKLQDSLIATVKAAQVDTHRHHVETLERQHTYRALKQKDLQKTQINSAKKKFKETSWLYQQYHSPRCWKTSKMICAEFNKLSPMLESSNTPKTKSISVILDWVGRKRTTLGQRMDIHIVLWNC